MNNSPALIFIKDLAGRYLQANRQFEIISHLSHEDLVGKTDEEILPSGTNAVFSRQRPQGLGDRRTHEIRRIGAP